MKPRILLVAAAFVVCAAAIRSESQRPPAAPQSARAADAVLPGPPESISLELPANLFTAHATFRRVLDAAGIRFGLEGPAWDPSVPPIDFARAHEDTLQLGGRRLADALDALVNAAPEFRWTESQGVIVVRATPAGTSLLDRKIPRFTLKDAQPRVALQAVINAIDPSRPPGLGMIGFGRPGSGAMGGPAKTGRNVTVDLTNVTVQEAMASIARLNGELTWTVQYDRAPASVENATIAFTELGETVTAQSRQTFQQSISSGPSPLRLPITSSMPAMLTSYASRVGIKLSIEEVGVSANNAQLMMNQMRSMAGLPPMELPGEPAAAVARIVALDSRYEFSQKAGRFHVRPRPGVPGRLDQLDTPMDGFVASNEMASAVIGRVARKLGTVRVIPFSSATSGRGPSPTEIAMATPININLTGPVTPRDVLDAIADVTGWTWGLRLIYRPGDLSQISLEWRGQSAGGSSGVAAGGWSTGMSITAFADLSPAPMPTRTPTRTIPAALDREIPQTALSMDAGSTPFQQLATSMRFPIAVETVPAAVFDDPRRMTRPKPPIVVGPGKFSDALYVLLESVPGYEIVSTDGIVNIAPTALVQSRDYFMSRPLNAFAASNVGLVRAVGELRRALDPAFEPRDWPLDGGDIMNRPVTLSVTNTSPREILNRLVRQHGSVMWASSFASGAGTGPVEARVENWIVTLTPTMAPGPVVSLAKGGPVAASTLLPRIARTPPLGSRSVTIDLPVTATTLRGALSMIGRATSTPIGFESVATTGVPLPPVRSDYYDLSGLEGEALLGKLRELAPDYEFSLANDEYHVRPRAAQSESTPWLDQRVQRFEQRFENLRDAIYAVAALGRQLPQRAGVPAPPPNSGYAPFGPPAAPVSPGLASMNQRLQKTLVISLNNVTVREILDEIAKQFGRMMWSVEQRTSPQGGTSLSLTCSGYDGWSFGTSVR